MNPPTQRLRGLPLAPLVLAWLSCTAALLAQTAATGTPAGRIYNPATREYVRHAEIRVEGTTLQTASEDGGHYSLANVPAGPAVVVVAYTGYGPARHTVTISAGQSLARDFDLGASTDAPVAGGERVVQLGAFVVSSEREGNAEAIMNQRNSMDLGTSIASDVFGDVTEGNVGEFLKYFPGIEMEYVEADSVSPRLGGRDPQYSGVLVDGMKAANADAYSHFGSTENGSTGSADRGFSSPRFPSTASSRSKFRASPPPTSMPIRLPARSTSRASAPSTARAGTSSCPARPGRRRRCAHLRHGQRPRRPPHCRPRRHQPQPPHPRHHRDSTFRIQMAPPHGRGQRLPLALAQQLGLPLRQRQRRPRRRQRYDHATRYRRHNAKFDSNVDFRFTPRLTAFVQARNILNESHRVFEASGLLWREENYGGNWVFGVRGEF